MIMVCYDPMKDRDQLQEITISEFKATCLAVIDRVKRTGKPVLVTRRGKPMAQVIPPPRSPTWLGCMAGTVPRMGGEGLPGTVGDGWVALREGMSCAWSTHVCGASSRA